MSFVSYDKEQAKAEFLESMRRNYDDAKLADLTIACGDKEWRVSRFVVCSQSEWFHKMCTGPFAEAKIGKIPLPADNPEVVSAMLHWCHHFDYDEPAHDVPTISPELFNVRVFALAEKCFIRPLQKLAVVKFLANAEDSWASPHFVLAAQEAYENTHDPHKTLRAAIVKIIAQRAKEIFKNKQKYPELHRAMLDMPELAMDVMEEIVLRSKKPAFLYKCFVPQCGGTQLRTETEAVAEGHIYCQKCAAEMYFSGLNTE